MHEIFIPDTGERTFSGEGTKGQDFRMWLVDFDWDEDTGNHWRTWEVEWLFDADGNPVME